jgi:Reverse transcriptase (RNA-dependent DNA polymerase)
MPAYSCPVGACACSRSRKADLLQHLRTRHAGLALSEAQLTALGAKYCLRCGVLRSCRGGHRCPAGPVAPVAHTFELPLEEPEPAPLVAPPPALQPAPQPVPANPGHPQPPQALAGPNQPQPHAPIPPTPPAGAALSRQGDDAARPPPVVQQAVRVQWARALTHVAEDVLSAVDRGTPTDVVSAFDALLLLPCRTLPDNGASRGRVRRINRRLARVLSDDADDADDLNADDAGDPDPAGPPRPPTRSVGPYRRAARIHRLLGLGSVRRAARVLESLPLAEPNAATVAALRALHPDEPAPALRAPPVAPAVVTAAILKQVLMAIPRGSAAGLSGWTYEHVRAATSSDQAAFDAVLRIVNAIVSGQLPHLPALTDSALLGLEKPGGHGLRPIAMGEVWLRLAGLCAMAACPGAGLALAPLQLGVGIAGGSQCLAHAVRAGIAADPGCVTVQVDMRNAFNCVLRSAVLDAVMHQQPSLLPFAQWVYGAPGRLFVLGAEPGTPPIASARGVRQGDPCGPLFFGMALQGPLEATQRLHPDARLVAYADDIFLQGSPAAVVPALRALLDAVHVVGLDVVLPKCGAYSADQAAAAAVAASLGIAHCTDGLIVAGTPIGSDAFVAAHAAARADHVCQLVDDLAALPVTAQAHFCLLRSSLAARMTHLPRTVPWIHLAPSMRRVEDKIHDAAFAIMRRPRVDSLATAQLALPLRFGGFGLPTSDELGASAAFLSAAALTQATMSSGSASFRPFDGPCGPPLALAWAALHDDAPGVWPATARTLDDRRVCDLLPSAQRDYSRFAAQRAFQTLLARCDPDSVAGQRDLARLRSCACGSSSAWLSTLPTTPGFRLRDGDFITALRHHLGLPQVPVGTFAVTCFCNAALAPADHAMSCPSLSGVMTMRHNILLGVWRRIARRAGVASAAEPALQPLQRRALPRGRDGARGDILLALPDALTVTDVSVIHPAAATYAPAASRRAGAAAAVRDAQKRALYAADGAQQAYGFVPLSVESYGRLGKPAMALLGSLATIASAGEGVTKTAFMASAVRELSVALCRGNGIMYRASLQALARASGSVFRAGLPVPTAAVD